MLDVRLWIKNGKVYLAPESHVSFACRWPDLFGWTPEDFRRVYLESDEPFGSDGGAAREVIVGSALREGWLRVRRFSHAWEYSSSFPEDHLIVLRSLLEAICHRPSLSILRRIMTYLYGNLAYPEVVPSRSFFSKTHAGYTYLNDLPRKH